MLTIGFTGTRNGMTILQRNKVTEYLEKYVTVTDDLIVARQGCCVGADEDFTKICHKLTIPVVGHPPIKTEYYSMKAQMLSCYVRRRKGYLSRNRDIVDNSNQLLATPPLHEDQVGPNQRRTGTGGTWDTINYARYCKLPVYIVYPDGSVQELI